MNKDFKIARHNNALICLMLYVDKEIVLVLYFDKEDMKECKRYAKLWASTNTGYYEISQLYNDNYELRHLM